MYKVILTIVFIPFTLFANNEIETVIETKTKTQSVSFHKIGDIKVVKMNFDKKEPLNSFIEVDVRGTYEGNTCGYKNISLKTTPYSNQKNPEALYYYLELTAFTEVSSEIEIGDVNCLAYSKESPFVTTLKLSINSWDDSQKEQNWVYVIRDSQKSYAALSFVYVIDKGWTLRVARL